MVQDTKWEEDLVEATIRAANAEAAESNREWGNSVLSASTLPLEMALTRTLVEEASKMAPDTLETTNKCNNNRETKTTSRPREGVLGKTSAVEEVARGVSNLVATPIA